MSDLSWKRPVPATEPLRYTSEAPNFPASSEAQSSAFARASASALSSSPASRRSAPARLRCRNRCWRSGSCRSGMQGGQFAVPPQGTGPANHGQNDPGGDGNRARPVAPRAASGQITPSRSPMTSSTRGSGSVPPALSPFRFQGSHRRGGSVLTEEEKWHFDIQGYLVLRNAVSPKDAAPVDLPGCQHQADLAPFHHHGRVR